MEPNALNYLCYYKNVNDGAAVGKWRLHTGNTVNTVYQQVYISLNIQIKMRSIYDVFMYPTWKQIEKNLDN